MRSQIFSALFFGVIFMTGYQVCGEESKHESLDNRMETIHKADDIHTTPPRFGGDPLWTSPYTLIRTTNGTATVHGIEYTVQPGDICPFTIEVYPKTLHFGDPLYVRLHFNNTTGADTYIPTIYDIERSEFAAYLKFSDVIIPWAIRAGFGTPQGRSTWRKLKPGESQTHNFALIPPESDVTGHGLLAAAGGYDHPRWVQERWDRRTLNATIGAQLVTIIENGNATLMVASPRFDIIPRGHEEMEMLEYDRPPAERGGEGRPWQRDDMKRFIPKMTPGTLQNQVKYECLLLELMESVVQEEEDGGYHIKILETQALETLEKIENFLKTLHEIEREVLKNYGSDMNGITGAWYIGVFDNNETVRKRIVEVFGERPRQVFLQWYGELNFDNTSEVR